ncbi:MAG: hypothetical protein IPL64_08430 [Flavobacteriales bacterium]|nr:hypothetical protein [Flavobacteriales bacterium]
MGRGQHPLIFAMHLQRKAPKMVEKGASLAGAGNTAPVAPDRPWSARDVLGYHTIRRQCTVMGIARRWSPAIPERARSTALPKGRSPWKA